MFAMAKLMEMEWEEQNKVEVIFFNNVKMKKVEKNNKI